MTAPPASVLMSLLQQTVDQLTSGQLDASAQPRALLVTNDVALSGNRSAMADVLRVMELLTQNHTAISLDTAYGIVNTLQLLEDPLSTTQAMQMLAAASYVANNTVGMTEPLGDALLSILERVTAALPPGPGMSH
jgi:hypothetical protein